MLKKDYEIPVIIEWEDSQIYTYQDKVDAIYETCIIKTIGYLLRKDKKVHIVARDLMPDDECRGQECIPNKAIVKIIYL